MMQAGSGHFFSSLLGLPAFALYLAVAVALLVLFALAYSAITAHDEMELIRSGNHAAGIAFGGTMIGFVIPLSKAVAQAGNIPDLLVWGFAAFIVQLLVYLVVKRVVTHISEKIEQGNVAASTFLAACAIAVGMLNAAAMSL